MAKELDPIDIGDRPELLRLAEGVRSSRARRRLTDGDGENAIVPEELQAQLSLKPIWILVPEEQA